MPSPFPGMDPYLEGFLWPDVHHALAAKLRQLLVPLVAPRYVARLEISILEDTSPEQDAGIMYPDIEVLLDRQAEDRLTHDSPGDASASTSVITPSKLVVAALPAMRVKLVSVQLRTVENDRLVSSIEILSPVNKRRPGLIPYRKKRLKLMADHVHLIELDLLRRGRRAIAGPRVPKTDYLLACTRAGNVRTELWPVSIRERLPVIPVPLLDPDADVPLQLPDALAAIYDEARYDLSIEYSLPPPPPSLGEADREWIEMLLAARKTG